jgi:hypothetical protein
MTLMVNLGPNNYCDAVKVNEKTTHVNIVDHMGGFDIDLTNKILDNFKDYNLIINSEYIVDNSIKLKYPNLQFQFDQFSWLKHNFIKDFIEYNQHPPINYKNFICSFNGTPHVSRKLLVAILEKFGYFNPEYCSKNFSYNTHTLDGHINDYVPDDINFYRKFFISDSGENFFQSVNSFGHIQFNHDQNIYNLESKITQSFLHVVSETLTTSYYPFVTEKFLYSVITRGLFLSYAQPGWHDHLEKYYGFKKYTKLFDYRFDTIQNPVKRLVELITMISKFNQLSVAEWHDLYLIEQEAIEYNYNHYFSSGYLKHLWNNNN